MNAKLTAQELKVKNVKFTDLGEKIIITYDLQGEIWKKFKVNIKLSDNGGKNFKIIPKAVKGDLGNKVKPGKNKEIVWDLFKDYPYGLLGNNFIFKVEAKYKKKRPLYWIYPVAVCTVVVPFLLFRHVDKSAVVIEVPAYY